MSLEIAAGPLLSATKKHTIHLPPFPQLDNDHIYYDPPLPRITYTFPSGASVIINAGLLEVNASLAHTSSLARSRWTRIWAAHVLRSDTAIEANRYSFDTTADKTLYKFYISGAAPKSSAFVFPSYGISINVTRPVHPG
ncbi:uncharacterized protein PG986_005173 [Apiospora aurea]|uniref:Uncharacterized protein n=1 Tax=Apiospora aurea TaxID=335848 RepID=A0ABR1QGS6_9PEZI